MDELKTLKDMNLLFKDRLDLQDEFRKWAKKNNVAEVPMSVIGWFAPRHKEQLRQEAIKWIKTDFYDMPMFKNHCNDDDHCRERDLKTWIEHFFNIKKEDLK